MKWTKAYLSKKENASFNYKESLSIASSTFDKSFHLLDLKDVVVEGKAKYDSHMECLMLDLFITGIMVMPCARTLEPVDYRFETNESVAYSFREQLDEDTIMVSGTEINTDDLIRELIILSIPIRVVKQGSEYKEPDETNEVDPRLAKLKDLF